MNSHSAEYAFLGLPLVLLAAAVISVPIARFARLSAIVAYLVAGVVIGPFGFGIFNRPETILTVAELGIVMLLFLIGLELELSRLLAMRRDIFGLGVTQLLLTAAAIAGLATATGLFGWRGALVAGLSLALSATSIALRILEERGHLQQPYGQRAFAILLFQDMSVVPLLALVPLMASSGAAKQVSLAETASSAALIGGAIVALVLAGRYLLNPFFRLLAWTGAREVMTAAALLIVLGAALLMQVVGMSMALGAFLAGVLLAESEYRRELETDIEPFKGLLLGLFFIAVGMSIDFQVVLARPWLIAALVVGFLIVKAVVLWGMGRAMSLPLPERPVFVVLLAQGGEFGFVVYQTAAQAGVIDAPMSSLLVAVVAISMLVTPLLLVAADRLLIPRLAGHNRKVIPEIDEPQNESVIIAGFGRYGQIVGRLLYANGVTPTVLDHDAEQIEAMRRFDWRVFYGDATRLDLLRTAGADKARVLVLAIDDVEQSIEVARMAREHFPNLTIVARARNVQHMYALRDAGVTHIERETLDSALMSGRSALESLGWEPHHARTLALRFRRHNIAQVLLMAPHWKDQARLITAAKQGRQQLEEQFAAEREEAKARQRRGGWDPHPESDGEPG